MEILSEVKAIRESNDLMRQEITRQQRTPNYPTCARLLRGRAQDGIAFGTFFSKLKVERMGLVAAFIRATNGTRTDYSISLRCQFPFLALLYDHLLWLELSLRMFSLCPTLHFPTGGIRLCRIVTRESPILQACERGDLELVVQLIRTGQAGLTNATSDGYT